MTPERLEQANMLKAKIALIDEMEKEVERFKKQRFSGSIPTSVSRYLRDNPEVAMQVVEMVLSEAVKKRIILQGQWDSI